MTAGSNCGVSNGTLNICGILSFSLGTSSQTFSVSISVDEADETIMLALSNPGNTTLGSLSIATLTIQDVMSYSVCLPFRTCLPLVVKNPQ